MQKGGAVRLFAYMCSPERCCASLRSREAVPRPRFAAANREPRAQKTQTPARQESKGIAGCPFSRTGRNTRPEKFSDATASENVLGSFLPCKSSDQIFVTTLICIKTQNPPEAGFVFLYADTYFARAATRFVMRDFMRAAVFFLIVPFLAALSIAW